MIPKTALPTRVARALHEDETVAALVSAGRPTGQSLPVRHWLVVTDRRLLVISHSRWSLDARLSRTIMLSRVRGASMRPPVDSMAQARIELVDRRDLDVELPVLEQDQLAELVRVVHGATTAVTSNATRSTSRTAVS